MAGQANWLMAAVLKTAEANAALEGSNPPPAARF